MNPSRAIFPTLALHVAIGVASAQTPALADLERRLRDPDLEALARLELVETLLEAGPRGAIVVARGVSAAAKSSERTRTAVRRDVVRRFERVAARIVHQSAQGREAEIEQLRQDVAALRANPSLSEHRILAVADPAVARLRQLVAVTVPFAIGSDDELASTLEAFERELDVLRDLRDAWERAEAELTTGDEPDRQLARLDAPPIADELDEELDRELELLARLATPMSKSAAQIMRDNVEHARALEPTEAAGIFALNSLRTVLGLPPLRIDLKLCAAAKDHSADMERLDFFSHTSPVPGKSTPGDRAARFGTSGGAENIARGHDTGPSAIEGWWYSPGHHRNMLARHGRVGLGRAGTLWTQMFGG